MVHIKKKEANSMADWKQMYIILCGGIADALDVLPELEVNRMARGILIMALNDAEEVYLAEGEEEKAH